MQAAITISEERTQLKKPKPLIKRKKQSRVACDWSVKDREGYEKEMLRCRQYLMKLCDLTREVVGTSTAGNE